MDLSPLLPFFSFVSSLNSLSISTLVKRNKEKESTYLNGCIG